MKPHHFDQEFLHKLEHLNILSKRLYSGLVKAERRSQRKGSGLEFADHRLYAPGDDFRYLDWNACLRLNRLMLRLFEEEQDLPIYIFVDSSRSMAFGRPGKLEYALRLAAALAYIGLANLDQVSLISYSDRIKSRLAARRGKNQILRVFNFLSEVEAGGETRSRSAFRGWLAESRRRGLMVLLSDLMEPEGFEAGLDLLRQQRQDVLVVQLISRDELHPELDGELLLVDSESRETCELSVSGGVLRSYRRQLDRFCEQIRSYCSKYQLGYFQAVTDFPFQDLVLKVFRQGMFLK